MAHPMSRGARASRQPMRPADIRHQVVVEEVDLAMDGTVAVVVRRTIRAGRYLGHLLAIQIGRAHV